MFQELLKCKTIKEIYTVLGAEPFEKAAYILLIVWVLLPIWSAVEHVYWGVVGTGDMSKTFGVMEGYKLTVQFWGYLSLCLAIFYLLGRIVMNRGQLWSKLKAEPWHFLFLAMLGWSCISTLLSDDIATSFHGTTYRFDGLKSYFFYAAVYVCAFIVLRGHYKKKVFDIFINVANVISLIVILQDFGVDFVNQCFLDTRAAVFFQFNHTGYYLCMAIVCAMGLYLYEESRKMRIWYVLSMAFQIYGILVNSTLGSFLGVVGAVVMILVFFVRKNGRFAWRMLTPILVVVLLSTASYYGYVPTSSGQDMKVNLETLFGDVKDIWKNPWEATGAGHGRMKLWQEGLKMIPERPIFGYGPEQLNEEYAKNMWVDRPDNEFIQHAIFLGIPGLLFYLGALITMFIHQWIYMKGLNATALIAAGCVIAYLISSCFGNTMFYTTPYLYMFLGCAAARVRKPVG